MNQSILRTSHCSRLRVDIDKSAITTFRKRNRSSAKLTSVSFVMSNAAPNLLKHRFRTITLSCLLVLHRLVMRFSALASALLPASLLALLLLLAPLSVCATPAPALSIHVRDDSHMHHSGQPMAEINETEILKWHLPTPPSYWSIDIEDHDPNVARYPGLVTLHAVFMSLAFFVSLPAGALHFSFTCSPVHLPLRNRSPLCKTFLSWFSHGFVLRLRRPRLRYQ